MEVMDFACSVQLADIIKQLLLYIKEIPIHHVIVQKEQTLKSGKLYALNMANGGHKNYIKYREGCGAAFSFLQENSGIYHIKVG